VVDWVLQFGVDWPSDSTGRIVWTVTVVAALLVVGFLSHRVGDLARRRFADGVVETLEMGLDTLLVALAAGLLALVWNVDVAAEIEGDDTSRIGIKIVVSLLVMAAAYGLNRVTSQVLRHVGNGQEVTDHRRRVAKHVTQVILYTLGGFGVLAVWGVRPANLLVGAGFLGIVVGLAARQALGDVIAGLVLLFSRPFEVGDWVLVGDSEGIVTDIDIYNTKLRTYDGEYVVIPNDDVTNTDIVNRSRRGRYRVTVEVGVDYETDLEHATAVARETVAGVEEVLEAPEPAVVAKGFGDSAVVLELRVWIDDPGAPKVWTTRTAVVEAVTEDFRDEGIEIPFPQRVVSSRGEDGSALEPARTRDPGSVPEREGLTGANDGPSGDGGPRGAGGGRE